MKKSKTNISIIKKEYIYSNIYDWLNLEYKTYKNFISVTSDLLGIYDLNLTEWLILFLIYKKNSAWQIALELKLSKGYISKRLKKLNAQKLIISEKGFEDIIDNNLFLTSKGLKTFNKAGKVLYNIYSEMIDLNSFNDITAYVKVLKYLKQI